jgi:predicted alpha/beta-fold hydrolase
MRPFHRRSDRTPWWRRNRHLQSILPKFFLPHPHVPALQRERLELPDGDFVDLDWVGGDRHAPGPLVLILHGLEGSAESHYARNLLAALEDLQWPSGVLHFRGCSGEPNRLTRSYHAGDTGDLAWIMERLADPARRVYLAGFSLGGNVLLKYLGEQADGAPVAGAVAVSVPFDLQDCAAALNEGFSRFYRWHLLGRMRQKLRDRYPGGHNAPFSWKRAMAARSFHEFDDAVTAPLHGFGSAAHYYQVCSSRHYLASINVPTLLIQSADDPFMTPAGLPDPNGLPDCVTLDLTEYGGHVGFVDGGTPWRPESSLTPRIIEFLTSIEQKHSKPITKR